MFGLPSAGPIEKSCAAGISRPVKTSGGHHLANEWGQRMLSALTPNLCINRELINRKTDAFLNVTQPARNCWIL